MGSEMCIRDRIVIESIDLKTINTNSYVSLIRESDLIDFLFTEVVENRPVWKLLLDVSVYKMNDQVIVGEELLLDACVKDDFFGVVIKNISGSTVHGIG